MVHFNGVSKQFGKNKLVLRNIDLRLDKGEILCLLGPSGCGKTTMVNLLMGRLLPTEGSVSVMGEKAPYPTVRERIGYMPQEDALYSDITAFENLYFFGRMNGMSKAEVKERAIDILNFGGLEDDASKLVNDFSGGMKRRLSLGVAMMHQPDLLVLDEPTVGLDPDLRRRIWKKFNELAGEGKTLLVTTHVMDEAARCNSIAMLYEGRIVAKGSPDQILTQTGAKDLEEAFLVLEEVNHNE